MLEITVGHQTVQNQIFKMSGHKVGTSHQHILSYLLQGVVSQETVSGQIYKMSQQKEDLNRHMSYEYVKKNNFQLCISTSKQEWLRLSCSILAYCTYINKHIIQGKTAELETK